MDRLPDDVVAAEAERDVREPARDERAGQPRLDLARRLDERDAVGVVLVDAGGDREHVRVEHDVVRVEPETLGQEGVGALADGDLALDGVRLPLLVEGHDDDGRAVASGEARLGEERLLALLQADRVDDALALQALEPPPR